MPKTKQLTLDGPQSESFASDIDELVHGKLPSNWEWVGSSKKTVVARRLTAPVVYYKEYLPRSGLEAIKNLMKGDRGTRAKLQGELLHKHGFQAPASLCWGSFNDHVFIMFDGLAGEPVGHYVNVRGGQLTGSELKLKHRHLRALAQEIGRLHACGIVHGDLRLNNILIDVKTSDIPTFYFIDNERNRQYEVIPRKLVVKNLLQLNLISPKLVSFNDRLRFFQMYNTVYSRFSKDEQKELAALIWQKTLKRFERPSLRDCHDDLMEIINS